MNQMIRYYLPLVAALAMLSACDNEKPAAEPTPPAATDTAVQPADATIETTRPGGFEPIDPATGMLALNVQGEHSGSWRFQDVNGSVSEQAGGGETTMTLQLEAHNDPVHLRLRLTSADGEVRQGRYTIGATDRSLDATYENAGVYYKSLGAAKGTVELTTFTQDRAAGYYDLTLETLAEKPAMTRLKGQFNMRVQR